MNLDQGILHQISCLKSTAIHLQQHTW